MNSRLSHCLGLLITLMVYSNITTASGPGPLMTVTGSGGPAGTVGVNVWLNGDGPLSGQTFYQVSGGYTLTITPTIPNHTYPAMGLEVTTPGLTVTGGCDRYVGDICIFSASNAQPKTLTLSPVTGSHYIFMTAATYTGNLGGVSGADALCTTAAQNSGNSTINTLDFKAVLVASNRYPCDQTGNCGGAYSADWPLLPNTPYLGPDGTQGANLITNGNAVFPQPSNSITTLRYETGATGPASTSFWFGIQSTYTAPADRADITGWAYFNVNPDSGTRWTTYQSTCDQWNSTTGTTPQSKGSTGQTRGGGPFASVAVVAGIWGNYFYQLDASEGAVFNTWTNANSSFCTSPYSIVCAH